MDESKIAANEGLSLFIEQLPYQVDPLNARSKILSPLDRYIPLEDFTEYALQRATNIDSLLSPYKMFVSLALDEAVHRIFPYPEYGKQQQAKTFQEAISGLLPQLHITGMDIQAAQQKYDQIKINPKHTDTAIKSGEKLLRAYKPLPKAKPA